MIFLLLSVGVYFRRIDSVGIEFFLALIACVSVVLCFISVFKSGKQLSSWGFLAEYTMPIFLMHTLLAAPLRTVLFKLDVQNAATHVLAGLLFSFVGPIAVAEIMKRFKWMEFFLYPNKYIRIK